MSRPATPVARQLLLVAPFLVLILGGGTPARAAVVSYVANLDGASEAPPNASPGLGLTQVDIDPVAHTMRVQVTFNGLLGNTTASHIHGPTAVAGTGTAGVITTTPTFTGFPTGVTSGTYDHTFDMTQTGSYNASFLTARGGNVAVAEADLFAAIAAGRAYLNVHSTFATGGEIRGFLVPGTTATAGTTWGRLKSMYR
jgi:hypothetical protein